MGYESKWGRGFPGWHLECSAIGLKFLGEQFDIHTGGIDLIPTHHTNEIAQSESATGKKPFVKFWLHSEHVDMANQKMAKSAGNFVKLGTIIEKGINPLAYRFWLLMAHYHTKMNFNWEALEASEVALKRLYRQYLDLRESVGSIDPTYQQKFRERISDDLDTPRAISLLWDLTKDEKVSDADKKATILDFDKVLSLGFANLKEDEVPEEIQKLVLEREEARKNKDWERSDEIRGATAGMGYQIEDTDSGPKVSKI
jgi:cysteinyl-tRNA synthetase